MKRKTTHKALAILLTLVLVLGMLPMSASSVITEGITEVTTAANSPVQITKSVQSNGNGTYKITMEAYVTGTVQLSEVQPLDIILVLDQSGSMAYDFAGNSTSVNSNRRQYAMKNAVNNFIDEVGANSPTHSMAIVTFGENADTLCGWTTTDSTGVGALKTAINGLPNSPSGATNVSAGMTKAANLLNNNSSRKKIVIVFTDGVPTTSTEFSVSVANGALATAQSMKDADVDIYTIGIFAGANPSQLHGDKYYRAVIGDLDCDGSENSFWGSTTASSIFSGDILEIDIAAGNRFLNYLSGNFANAPAIGITSNYAFPGIAGGSGWYIQSNAVRTSSDYYMTAVDSFSLLGVFSEIVESIVPGIEAGSDAQLTDTLAGNFVFAAGNATNVAIAQSDAYGTEAAPLWRDPVAFTGTKEITEKEISVSGFEYSENAVVKGSEGWTGKKLIISFDIAPDPNAQWEYGPNWYDTNESAGLYTADSTLCELTESPQVQITAYKVSYAYSGTVPAGAPACPADAVYLPGAAVTVAGDVSLDGYSFSGWGTNPESADITSGAFTMPENDVVFSGSWTAQETNYTVEHWFESLTGSFERDDTLTTNENSTVDETTAAVTPLTVTGFTFDAANEGNVLSDTVKPNGETVLKLYYTRNTHKVTYEYAANTPAGASALPAQQTDVKFGQEVTVAGAGELSGYDFLGWTITSPAGFAAPEGKFTMPDSDVVLTGAFRAGDADYTVEHWFESLTGSFERNDALTTNENGTVDETTAAVTPLTVTGFTFDAANAGNVLSDTVKPNGETVLKLYYTRNTHKVTYEYAANTPAGASALPAQQTDVKFGQEVTVAGAGELSGYDFLGWTITSPAGFAAPEGKFTMPDSDVVLTGAFRAGNANYTVEHYFRQADGTYVKDGALTQTKTATTDTSATAVPYTDAEVPGFFFSEGNEHNVTEGIVLGDNSLVLKLYYDIRVSSFTIPFTKIVEGENAPAESFAFETAFSLGQFPNTTVTVTAGAVATNGAGNYNGTITVTGPYNEVEFLKNYGYFTIKETNTGAEYWTYSDAEYIVKYTAADTGAAGVWMAYDKSAVTPTALSEPVDLVFVNTYSEPVVPEIEIYDITVINGEAANDGGAVITQSEAGLTITIRANTPESGKVFDKWIIKSDTRPALADDTDATTTFTMPEGHVTVEATYKDIPPIPGTGSGSLLPWIAFLFAAGMGAAAFILLGNKKKFSR